MQREYFADFKGRGAAKEGGSLNDSLMKSLSLHIQSSLDSLHDCLQELTQAHHMALAIEDEQGESAISSTDIDRVATHCLKAQRELQTLWTKVRL